MPRREYIGKVNVDPNTTVSFISPNKLFTPKIVLDYIRDCSSRFENVLKKREKLLSETIWFFVLLGLRKIPQRLDVFASGNRTNSVRATPRTIVIVIF